MLPAWRFNIISLLVGVFLSSVSLVAFQMVRTGQDAHVASLTETYSHLFTAKLEERLQSRFAIAEILRNEMQFSDRDLEQHFVTMAQSVHHQLDDLQALNWVNADGVIEIVTPREGNEAALGLDVMSLEAPSQALMSARENNALHLTPPITLAQGGRGFVAYLPVRKDGQLSGYINVVFRAAPIIESAGGDEADSSFLVSVYDSGVPIHASHDAQLTSPFMSTTRFAVGGREWTIDIAPTAAELAGAQSLLDEGVLLSGLVMALVISLLIGESARSKEAIRDREERFSLAMKGASDGLFDWNSVTGETYLSPRWFQMLGYAEDELPPSHDTFTSLVHPDDLETAVEDVDELSVSGQDFLEKEFRMRHKSGKWHTILSRGYVVRKAGRVVRVVGTHVDVSEIHERQRELERVAMTDDLTGLQNRRGLSSALSTLERSLSSTERLVLLHLDLDKFKAINDTDGHEAGDYALEVTADRLRQSEIGFDLIARVGGDEFLLAKKYSGTEDHLLKCTDELIADVSAPFQWQNKQLRLGASIGIAFADRKKMSQINQTISNSDTALKSAKSLGRGRCVVFEEQMREEVVRTAEFVREIENGLEQGEFKAHFQPQIELHTGRIVGFEALARWEHPTRGLLSADQFVPYAEKSHLIEHIDDQVLQHACQTLKMLSTGAAKGASVSVNMSTAQLCDPNLVHRLEWSLQQWDLLPQCLSIEILESTLLSERTANVLDNIQQLVGAGFRLELDDFGTGHTAISSLLNFPVSQIKIDRSLISNVEKEEKQQVVTRAIIDLGSKLGIKVLAEGVEDAKILDFLINSGCYLAQGYYLARPMPQDALDQWIGEWTAKAAKTYSAA